MLTCQALYNEYIRVVPRIIYNSALEVLKCTQTVDFKPGILISSNQYYRIGVDSLFTQSLFAVGWPIALASFIIL